MNDAGVTNIQLMTILGNLYGFEVRPQAETGEATAPDLLADLPQRAGTNDEFAPGPSDGRETEPMAKKKKKLCKNGCGRRAQLAGLCYKCYVAENGKESWPYQYAKPKKDDDGEKAAVAGDGPAIAVRIKRLREEKGQTLRDFADATGVSFSYVGQIERGARPPSELLVERICALGVRREWLVDGEGEPYTRPAEPEKPVVVVSIGVTVSITISGADITMIGRILEAVRTHG
jgi:DNA-binding XRE family transcriptional regulator